MIFRTFRTRSLAVGVLLIAALWLLAGCERSENAVNTSPTIGSSYSTSTPTPFVALPTVPEVPPTVIGIPIVPVVPVSEYAARVSMLEPELAVLYGIDLKYGVKGRSVWIVTNIVGGPDSHPKMHCKGNEIKWGNEIVVSQRSDSGPYREGDKFQRAYSYSYEFEEPETVEIVFTF